MMWFMSGFTLCTCDGPRRAPVVAPIVAVACCRDYVVVVHVIIRLASLCVRHAERIIIFHQLAANLDRNIGCSSGRGQGGGVGPCGPCDQGQRRRGGGRRAGSSGFRRRLDRRCCSDVVVRL